MWYQLKKSPGYLALIDHLNKKQGIRGAKVLNGRCEDFAEYKHESGFCKGIQYVMDHVEKMSEMEQKKT